MAMQAIAELVATMRTTCALAGPDVGIVPVLVFASAFRLSSRLAALAGVLNAVSLVAVAHRSGDGERVSRKRSATLLRAVDGWSIAVRRCARNCKRFCQVCFSRRARVVEFRRVAHARVERRAAEGPFLRWKACARTKHADRLPEPRDPRLRQRPWRCTCHRA